MLSTKNSKSTFQKKYVHAKKHVGVITYGVNPRTLFYMGFECLEIKLLKGLG